MIEKIRVFTIPLYPSGTPMTDSMLESRKKEIRSEVMALIPAVKNLVQFTLRELVVVENNQLLLAFYLVDSLQNKIKFDNETRKRKGDEINQLITDLERLKESARHCQIRIGELTMKILDRFDNGIALEDVLSSLDYDEKNLWQIICAKKGKKITLNADEKWISFVLQFPDLPICLPEKRNRIICAHITNISSHEAEVSVMNEAHDSYVKNQPLPREISLYPPVKKQDKEKWPQLYAAMHQHITLEMEVRVGIEIATGKPVLLELVNIKENNMLIKTLSSWAGKESTLDG